MTKLPTTKKPSIKDVIVSALRLSIKSLGRAVAIHWSLLFIEIPAVMTAATISLGYLTAPELCRESFDCVQMHVVQSTKPFFGSIEGLQSIPDDGKLPVLLAIACMYLFAFAVFVYASQTLVASFLQARKQNDAG